MKQQKTRVHFTDNTLINPTNPVSVNLIGAGGTGSQMLTALARINHALNALDHAGLQVTVFDEDIVTKANLGRQLFAEAEIGMNKGTVLINRHNRFFGTNWKAIPQMFSHEMISGNNEHSAGITISCVDSVAARYDIADILVKWNKEKPYSRNRPLYWLDYGNSQHTGQLILATIGKHIQPASKKFKPVPVLPSVTDEFHEALQQTDEKAMPSCSFAEAIAKQDLFINPAVAYLGASLLWQMFREGMIRNRGFFLNLQDLRAQPIIV